MKFKRCGNEKHAFDVHKRACRPTCIHTQQEEEENEENNVYIIILRKKKNKKTKRGGSISFFVQITEIPYSWYAP